ncbi:tRNA-uridine aminocarboxypropyltransferase 2-like [Apostichopus japonicus]|uniref:tRNA-uridine aminocarboxypropyltransferase 2-like n=1 Tax=Stichopus japonicus TaxID=307972 RepID=UPI003AB479EB
MEDLMSLPCEPAIRRSECNKCGRPSNVCLCPFLPANPIAIKSSVFLVQHPREEKRRVRTDYLVKGCLPKEKCFVIKGKKFSPKRYPELEAICSNPNTIILFPGPKAVKITDVPELTDGAQGYNLIVVDGTWAQAKGIFWSNSVLHKPLQVQLNDVGPSEFVIRMQPTYGSLSTVESVALALSVLEKQPSIRETMLTALRGLCGHQLDFGAVEHHCKEDIKKKGTGVTKEDVGDR